MDQVFLTLIDFYLVATSPSLSHPEPGWRMIMGAEESSSTSHGVSSWSRPDWQLSSSPLTSTISRFLLVPKQRRFGENDSKCLAKKLRQRFWLGFEEMVASDWPSFSFLVSRSFFRPAVVWAVCWLGYYHQIFAASGRLDTIKENRRSFHRPAPELPNQRQWVTKKNTPWRRSSTRGPKGAR